MKHIPMERGDICLAESCEGKYNCKCRSWS